MCASVIKLSVLLLCLILALISSAQAYRPRGCQNFGHSCWGGHGKRSGRSGVYSALSTSTSSGSPVSGRIPKYQIQKIHRMDPAPDISSGLNSDGVTSSGSSDPPSTSLLHSSSSSFNRFSNNNNPREIPLGVISAASLPGGFVRDKYLVDEGKSTMSEEERPRSETEGEVGEEDFSSSDDYNTQPNDGLASAPMPSQTLPFVMTIRSQDTDEDKANEPEVVLGFERTADDLDGTRTTGVSGEESRRFDTSSSTAYRKAPGRANLLLYRLIRIR